MDIRLHGSADGIEVARELRAEFKPAGDLLDGTLR